ncbi:MAG TPA: CAP domain-containing protein [Terracidiphilus sp.]|nr:CAP domain-containing protein [Terracidiphilus sp.]
MNTTGKFLSFLLAIVCLLPSGLQAFAQSGQNIQASAEELLALANRERMREGLPLFKWDAALADAALKHTRRMSSEGGAIQHDYPGELELSERAGLSGAHFDLIEENIAVGPTPAAIHDAWMHSKAHRENMLNPQVNRIGIAVLANRGVLYATADLSRAVEAFSNAQVEERVAALIARRGVKVLPVHSLAREACPANRGFPRVTEGAQPSFVMRWQDSDLSRLPDNLVQQLGSGRYHEAEVGTCQPSGEAGTFTAYRIAVLLY